MTTWQRIATATVGEDYAVRYAERFRAMSDRGEDTHGEASFVATLAEPPARVLDAGCGTGRVAVRLHELGYEVAGVDVDDSMLAQARAEAPHLTWHLGDLASLDLGAAFDLVLVAGNTVPLLEPGTLGAALDRLAAHVAPDGLLVCGFGLDAAHLPGDCPVTPWTAFADAARAAGLEPVARYATWDGAPFEVADGYVVSVDRRPDGVA